MNTTRYVHVFPRGAFAPGLCAAVAMILTTTGGVAAVECGEVLSGVERLDEDLICTTDPALTLGGGRLDLRGHAVICDGTIVGVVLEGEGARFFNGAVTGCQFAVLVEGDGNRLVRDRVLLGGTNAIRNVPVLSTELGIKPPEYLLSLAPQGY